MYRSGSTWQYEVVSHLIEQHRAGRRLGFVTGERYAGLDCPAGWCALKAHEGHSSFVSSLGEGRARAVYCYRDLRDVAFSLAHVYRTSLEDIVQRQRYLQRCMTNDDFWRRRAHVLCQRYEDIVADPSAAVAAIARHLGIALQPGAAAAVSSEYSLEANRRRAAAWEEAVRARGVNPDDPAHGLLPEDYSLLHWNHIREGRVGGWRGQATVTQRATLALVCGEWLKKRGYETNDAWALESLTAFGAIEAELNSLRRERADFSERLARAEIAHHAASQQLEALERLGPVALGLAGAFHALSLRFPRLRNLVKKVLSLGRPERGVAPAPGWTG
jgi:hypothetical protein